MSRNKIRKYLPADTVEPKFKIPVRSSMLDPFAEKLGNRRWYLAMSCGSKLPWRSRGTSISILPVSVTTVLRP